MLEEYEKNPGAKIMLVNECKERISNLYDNRQIDLTILNVLVVLYEYDYKKLKADISKIIIMDSCDLNYTNQERHQLLKLFIACRKKNDFTDFSYLLGEIDRVIEAKKDTGLPFV